MRAGCALLMAAALLVCAAPASAQTTGDPPYLDAVDAWADGQSLRRLLPGAGAQKQPRAKQPTARQLAALRFKRTEAVKQSSYQAVMALLEPGFDPAALTADFDRITAMVHKDLRRLSGQWSPNNIADVAAFIQLGAYAAFTSRGSLPDRGVRAVQRAARTRMALDKRVRRLPDARTQQAAEMLELRTILRVSDINVGRMNGDAAREQAARGKLRTWIKESFGLDLAGVKLTRRGFVKR
jgi:hypothetical protein